MPNRNPKRGLVAFIDLLGFSARVRAIQDPAELGALDRGIRRVQRAFEHKTADPILREKQKIFQKKVLAFSDCIVVAMSEKSDFAEMQGHFDTEMSELSEFASAQGLCVLNNIFVRGGVAFGWYYHRKDTLVSEALVTAVELEKHADVPMISLSEGLYNRLANSRERQHYSEDFDPFPDLLKRFRLEDGSEQFFVDYMTLCIKEIDIEFSSREERDSYRALDADAKSKMGSEIIGRARHDWIVNHREAIIRAHRSAQTEKVRAKYRWLADYHNSTLGRLYGQPRAEWLISELEGEIYEQREVICRD